MVSSMHGLLGLRYDIVLEESCFIEIPKDENAVFNASCCNDMKVVYFKPQPSSGASSLSSYGISTKPTLDAAFYADLILKSLDAVNTMKNSGSWPSLSVSRCADYTSDAATARSLDLVSALKSSSSPDLWGKMMFESNGHSYMSFKVDVHLHKVLDGSSTER